MKLKKILAFLLTMALLVSSLTGMIPVSAETTATLDVWDGSIATEYAGGSGTVSDPYLISTPEQLALMAIGTVYGEKGANIKDKYYKLTADIYLNNTDDANWKENDPNEWVVTKTSHPDSKYFFTGNFDGDGHTVYGIYSESVYARKGLFPGVYGNVSIKNITISDAYLNSTGSESVTNRSRYVGALVGMSYQTITKIKFENCYVADSVHLEALHTTAGFVGGGACSSISFVSCASFAHVTNRHSSTVRYGSFIGNFDSGDRKISYNNCIGSLVYTSYIQYPTYTASYCAVTGTVDSNTSNKKYPTVVSLEDMKGETAKTAMPALSWNVWKVTENYPVIDFDFFKREDLVYSFDDWRGGTNDISDTGLKIKDVDSKDGSKSLVYDLVADSKDNYAVARVTTLNEGTRVATAKANNIYDLTFWYKVDAVPTNAGKFVVYTVDPNGGANTTDAQEKRKLQVLDEDIVFNSTTDGWVTATARFKASLINDEYNAIAIGVVGVNGVVDTPIYIDAVSVEEAKIDNKNIVYSFDDWRGGTTDISASGIKIKDVDSKDGSKSLVYDLVADGKTNYTIARVAALSEGVVMATAEANTIYELDFWYKVDAVPTNAGKFVVYTVKPGGGANTTDADGFRKLQVLDKDVIFDNATDGWVNATVRFQPSFINTEYNAIAIGVVGVNGVVDTPVYIDSVTFKEAEFTAGEAWSGYVANTFAGGTGAHNDPYLIANAEQFAKALANTAEPGKYYKFISDIYLNDISVDNWTENSPKSWYDRALYGESGSGVFFEGNVDGAGHTIYGAYYNGTRNAGIFPKVKDSTISNLRISDASLTTKSSSSMGAIVGWGAGVINFNNCAVEASVTISADRGVSAFVGYASPSVTINNCYSLATLTGTGNKGAFFGEVWLENGTTREIYNSFAVGAPLIWDGSGEDPVKAINCYSTVADTEVITDGAITVLTEAEMKGANALVNMSDLEGFYTTDGYPAIKAIGELLGDVNGDWKCDSSDLTFIAKYLLGTSDLGLIDVNSDGQSDIRDLVFIKMKTAELIENNNAYSLVWFDDFAGSTKYDATDKFTTSNWTLMPRAGYADNVFAAYDDANVNLDSGNLNLKSFVNEYYDPEKEGDFAKSQYVVPGSVQTENKMSYKYGYLEIRAKVPYKEGCWPAFWLRSNNATGKNANAPYEVEIDIFEVFGSRDTMRSNLHQHYSVNTGEVDENGDPIIEHTDVQTTGTAINNSEYHKFANATDLYNEYHTYGFEWTEDRMAVYVDRELQCEWYLDAESLASYGLNPDTTGFDTTMNVLFGNNLITKLTTDLVNPTCIEDYEENLPAEYNIDWIRLYQKNDGLSELYIG